MEEVNRLCVRVLVHQEDVKENPLSAQKRRDSLRESAQAPVTCLVGTMATLSEAISHLPLLPRPGHLMQISSVSGNVQPESTADDEKTEKPPSLPWLTSHKSKVATEKRGERMKMVELYQCPVFTDIPVPLPHDTAYATIVTRVVQAQRHLVHKPSLKASFQTILSSSTVEHFVIDSFWWFFLHNFQPDRKTQDRLFCRIAENYISILTQNLSTRSGTTFLRDFPSTLSQTLYCCFCCCFPQSCGFRDQTFLTALCLTAYQWTGGICPAPEVYKAWDFEALEPDEASGVSESEKRQKESGSTLTLSDSMFSSTSLFNPTIHNQHGSLTGPKKLRCVSDVNEASIICSRNNMAIPSHKSISEEDVIGTDLKSLTDHVNYRSARKSHAVYACVELKQCVFNVWGNSPLVQHYMTTLNLKQTVGQDLLVRRTQIQKLPPYPYTLNPIHSDISSFLHTHLLRGEWCWLAQGLIGTVLTFGPVGEDLTKT
ncbi:protein FAM227A-like [Colossoma macropomum]|uniref:protein FAM227A-like n=1 Tax=Colossoma macropomum TaxID=42526 RepID=UPI001863B04A|nr:protein FAM227A-like [Colossoma macropomum]